MGTDSGVEGGCPGAPRERIWWGDHSQSSPGHPEAVRSLGMSSALFLPEGRAVSLLCERGSRQYGSMKPRAEDTGWGTLSPGCPF